EQADDDVGAPVGHLPPGQHVTHETFGHQHQVDGHAEDPDQLARLLVRTVHKPAEHVQVDHDEEGRSTRGVHVAQNPAVVDITHDVFDGGECSLGTGVEVHGEPDAGEDLVDQHHHGQHAEDVPEVEVLRRVVLAHVLFKGVDDRQAGVDPVQKAFALEFVVQVSHQEFSDRKSVV